MLPPIHSKTLPEFQRANPYSAVYLPKSEKLGLEKQSESSVNGMRSRNSKSGSQSSYASYVQNNLETLQKQPVEKVRKSQKGRNSDPKKANIRNKELLMEDLGKAKYRHTLSGNCEKKSEDLKYNSNDNLYNYHLDVDAYPVYHLESSRTQIGYPVNQDPDAYMSPRAQTQVEHHKFVKAKIKRKTYKYWKELHQSEERTMTSEEENHQRKLLYEQMQMMKTKTSLPSFGTKYKYADGNITPRQGVRYGLVMSKETKRDTSLLEALLDVEDSLQRVHMVHSRPALTNECKKCNRNKSKMFFLTEGGDLRNKSHKTRNRINGAMSKISIAKQSNKSKRTDIDLPVPLYPVISYAPSATKVPSNTPTRSPEPDITLLLSEQEKKANRMLCPADRTPHRMSLEPERFHRMPQQSDGTLMVAEPHRIVVQVPTGLERQLTDISDYTGAN